MENLSEILKGLKESDKETFLENACGILFLYQNDIEQLKQKLGVSTEEEAAVINNAVVGMMAEKGISDAEMDAAIEKMKKELVKENSNAAAFHPSSCPDYIVRHGKKLAIALGATSGVVLGAGLIGGMISDTNPNGRALKWALAIGFGTLGVFVSIKVWNRHIARIEKKIGVKISE